MQNFTAQRIARATPEYRALVAARSLAMMAMAGAGRDDLKEKTAAFWAAVSALQDYSIRHGC